MTKWITCLVALMCASAFADPSFAGAGHDHGHDAAPVTSSPSSPRFAAHSEAFEIVGILQGDELAVFVDRYDDNEPVLDAKVEIESGAFKAVGTFHADHGDYSFPAEAFKQPGSYPIQITVTTKAEVDLLGADLVVPDRQAGHDHFDEVSPLRRWSSWAGGGIAIVLALIGWSLARARGARRSQGAA